MVVHVMHASKLSRQVLLEYWKGQLMDADCGYECKDIMVGLLDRLIAQTRRTFSPAPTTFHRFLNLPTKLQAKVWQGVLLEIW